MLPIAEGIMDPTAPSNPVRPAAPSPVCLEVGEAVTAGDAAELDDTEVEEEAMTTTAKEAAIIPEAMMDFMMMTCLSTVREITVLRRK